MAVARIGAEQGWYWNGMRGPATVYLAPGPRRLEDTNLIPDHGTGEYGALCRGNVYGKGEGGPDRRFGTGGEG